MKLPVYVILICVAMVSLISACSKGTPSTLPNYYAGLDKSCGADADCVVKDVRNCCGEFLQCVNTNAAVNPAQVASLCEKEGTASVCGFAEISSCGCVEKKCVAK